MNFDRNKILAFLEESNLPNMVNFIDDDAYYFYDSLDAKIKEEYDYNYGATKCVLIPHKGDYVIKIPFTGVWDFDSDAPTTFCSAPCSERDWDYCGAEYERYKEAYRNNLKDYFAPVLCIGCVGHFPIYVQAKCITLEDKYSCGCAKSFRFSDEERNKTLKISKACWVNINLDWLTDFRLSYGEKIFDTFLRFLCDREWDDDLRTENIGYLNDRPVLIDYAGFLE